MTRPLCFVLMPFGKKPDAAGCLVDFDAVYHDLIAPAIWMNEAAGRVFRGECLGSAKS